MKLYGQYETNLFPGAATYSYNIEVPKGTNDLQPSLILRYNSQTVKQRPGALGAGWSLNYNYIYRNVNATPGNISDDKFVLVLDGYLYELFFFPQERRWHTETESFFKIENLTSGSNTYWLLTKKDGTSHRFGYNNDSRLDSNINNYVVKWSLDLINDTHDNKIYYTYSENPNAEDNGSVYLTKIEYNDDKQRRIEFGYEASARPDRRRVYEQGNLLDESRRLKDIIVYSNGSLVRKYSMEYKTLTPALSSLSKITYFGSDNVSLLHNISFEYYESEPGYYKNTTWNPPVEFSDVNHADYGVRAVDLNNDGWTDIIKRKPNDGSGLENKVWINDKVSWVDETAVWQAPGLIVQAGGGDLGVRIIDMNNDGYPEFFWARYNGGDPPPGTSERHIFVNNKTGWSDYGLANWVPFDFVDNNRKDLGYRFADVDGDGWTDIPYADSGSNRTYLNGKNFTSWIVQSSWTVPVNFVDANGNDLGVRIEDVNGDGLPDLIKARGGDSRHAWLNNGSGWADAPDDWTPPIDFATGSYLDTGARLVDANGDGLVDIIQSNSSLHNTSWLNNGTGWTRNDSWQPPEEFTKDGYNIGRRLADIDGDGFADMIVSLVGSPKYSMIKNTTTPYLLKTIVNEYGGVTEIRYTSSNNFNNSEKGTSEIGFAVYVVNNMTITNGLNSSNFSVSASTTYNYSLGKYDYNKSEFRGFGRVVELKNFSVFEHYFYQDNARKGKAYKTEIYNLSKDIYSKNIKNYNWTFSQGIYNVTLLYSENYLYDGISSNPKATNQSYIYDGYGNVKSVYDFGDVSVTGDEKQTNYTYAYNTTYWIVEKPASEAVYDANSSKVKESLFFYDALAFQKAGNKGELTRAVKWNNNGTNASANFIYDSYGNIANKTDSLGYSTMFFYDATGTYVNLTKNALGHVTKYQHSLGTGNLDWEEKDGIRKTYVYDTFGRVIAEVMPYDTNASPTKAYSYSFNGTAPERVSVTLKANSTDFSEVHYYYDGFANLVQIKTNIENSKQIVKNIFYDEYFRVRAEQNPYFDDNSSGLSNSNSSVNKTFYTYDVLDRVTAVLNPDGTSKNTSFNKTEISDYDENGNRHKYVLDGYDRITKVYEYLTNESGDNETYTTTYEYNTNDNLIKITDALGNNFTFTYDSLGRKIKMSDPDLGNWTYVYDSEGNLIEQRDARNNNTNLTYDSINRVLTKKSANENVTFVYDKEYNGTLFNISSTSDVLFTYDYDDRLRIAKETKTINGINLDMPSSYDSQNRIISKNGTSDIGYVFDRQGKVQQIPNFINRSGYNAFGSPLNRTYANSLLASFSYDSDNNRLKNILILNVQNLTYRYDNVGNIVNITDPINSRNHDLKYDTLDRLIEAKIGSDTYAYFYNAIGDMIRIVENSNSKTFSYSGKQAHAPSMISIADEKALIIQDSQSNNVSYFDNFGNIVLKGSCISTGACNPTANSFIIRNSTDGTVAYINETGDMCISIGTCTGNSATCNPTNDALIIQNTNSKNVSYIDNTGDLCLIGTLTQNGNP